MTMPREATLHVKLDTETDERLKRLAAARGKSKAQLVREAISACLQTSLEDLPQRQRQAVSAFQGGYISLGKLAREMGMHVLQLREWLAERGLEQQTAYGDTDADLA
jgi:predicted DNA-binding protein